MKVTVFDGPQDPEVIVRMMNVTVIVQRWADATKTSKPRLADERQCSLAEVTRERDDLKAKLAEAELEIVNHDHAEWAKRDRIKASDALNAVTQERDDLTAAHRRLWNALDRIASLNRTELPDHIDPFALCVCVAQDAIGPQDDVEDDKE